jgi:cytochrome c oxidase cbb3-type subunit 3
LRSNSLALVMLAALAAGRVAAQTEDHQYTTARILAGARLYDGNCQLCHGKTGDGIGAVNLSRQRFRRASTDDDLRNAIRSGVIAAGMPPFSSLNPDELDSLVAFIRSGFDRDGTALRLGDAARGKALFEGRGGCSDCHLARGDGPNAAPNLADIGLIRLPSEIRNTILEPTKFLRPINRAVRIVTHDGMSYRGRRLNEDSFSILLIDHEHGLVAVPKDRVREYEKSATSSMPSFAGKLSDAELADLMAYLVALKGD